MTKWTEDELSQALELKTMGLTYREIGKTMGRSMRSVQCAFERHHCSRSYRDIYHGDPIAKCADFTRYQRNAIEGSARLLAAIENMRRAA
jgi:hypothetical protein